MRSGSTPKVVSWAKNMAHINIFIEPYNKTGNTDLKKQQLENSLNKP